MEYAFTATPNTSYVLEFLIGGINITSLQIQEVCATLGSMQATRYRYRYNGKEQLSRYGACDVAIVAANTLNRNGYQADNRITFNTSVGEYQLSATDDYYINSWSSQKEIREDRNLRPIIVSLNLDLISTCANNAAKDLVFVIYYEVRAHSDRVSEGVVDSSIVEDLARFYNDSTLLGRYSSPPSQQVKGNSQAGRAIKKISSYRDEK